ncbi:transferase [Luteimonas terricola]|uniref:spermine/spermidine synthase domain-containing protein n=1 Tax=Luteimonas terricola TaxID=645597 RepID=UPI00104871BB|nr:transferase [Luteimonas terricola]
MAVGNSWWHRLTEAVARLRGAGPLDPTGLRLRPARVRQYNGYVSLHFIRGQTQSRMRSDAPDHLLIDYTRTMLAALLWRPRPGRIGIVGLGGGSQVKFLHRHLPQACLQVVENHPGVLALRRAFGIPDDDSRLEVTLDDGARFIAARPARYDLLLVDGYDAHGIPEALSTPAFLQACRDALLPGGVMASNLHGDDPAVYVERLRQAFGAGHVLLVGEAKMSNRIAFAWTGEAPDDDEEGVQAALAALSGGDARRALSPVFGRVALALRRQRTAACAS